MVCTCWDLGPLAPRFLGGMPILECCATCDHIYFLVCSMCPGQSPGIKWWRLPAPQVHIPEPGFSGSISLEHRGALMLLKSAAASSMMRSQKALALHPTPHSLLEVPEEGYPAPTPASPCAGLLQTLDRRHVARESWGEDPSPRRCHRKLIVFVEYYLFCSEKSIPIPCWDSKETPQQSLPYGFLMAPPLQPGCCSLAVPRGGLQKGSHQVGPGPLRESRVQRVRGLLERTWGQEGGLQCALQQRRSFSTGALLSVYNGH